MQMVLIKPCLIKESSGKLCSHFVMMTRKLNLMDLGYLQLLGLVLSSKFDVVCKVVCLMHQNKFCNGCKSDANTCELPCPLGTCLHSRV
jgi:hypothetical protein